MTGNQTLCNYVHDITKPNRVVHVKGASLKSRYHVMYYYKCPECGHERAIGLRWDDSAFVGGQLCLNPISR